MKDIDNPKNPTKLKSLVKKKGEPKFKRTILPIDKKTSKKTTKASSIKKTKKKTKPKRIIINTPAKRTVYLKDKVKKRLKKKRLKQEKPKTTSKLT